MKVNHFNAANQVNPYQRQANMTKQVEQAKTNQADKLEISSKALEMQKTSQSDPARQAKVEQLKMQVENGTYHVDANELAKSLVQHFQQKRS
ncbi:flagellar biosynthesis anti-sigma factor FlgM [Cytobacillus sp. FSL W7-1323]|uniref:Negative regulator of flagellin synthesis n=2 Tax=Cytobacillus TaxID=2675230 RepID=A0A248TJB4_9BACI|nr:MULTISPECIES: flagellar biosynthesis anti-sigma factor FlgM [Cytobacillus]ASV68255.1 flagellar biosynthesis anti-sigma factor FlgM [Cytobacillus kochii]MBD7937108.1 flagellar biosynthesis anti-sigma factor FlgM [Cytobacillus stercorigallinarum]MCA1026815.1 flagellar biosynthesis anti-sigma factor FlgM [Cytobacillus kochii]MCM3322761.1 flagellar biosynthesis anti-sigma factor FlgM [Cytobacillus kochii]MCM3344760.1 flagellar biosynthesis anti-sigma factor FlgM [Cytobacillus kochii]